MNSRRTLDQQHSIIEAAHDYGIILDSREIFLNGEVDEDGTLGTRFITNLRLLRVKSLDPIIIHQHSLGGDWACGMMIFDAIVTCECPIIFICHGIAASMGSIIPSACVIHGNSYRVNMPNCDWLLHDGYTDINSNLTVRQSRSWHDWEKTTTRKMIDWYIQAMKTSDTHKYRTDRQLRSFLDSKFKSKEDWWLNARESVEQGFADAVMGDKGFETLKKIKSQFKHE